MNRQSGQKPNMKKQISIDVEEMDRGKIGYGGRQKSAMLKAGSNPMEEIESASMNEVVTSRKDDDEMIEDDVTTNRDGLRDTFDDRDGFKSVERMKGSGLSIDRDRKASTRATTFKNAAQTPQVNSNFLNQTKVSHTSIDDSNYDNDEFDNLSVSKSLGNIGLGLGASKQAKFGTHTMGENRAFLLG